MSIVPPLPPVKKTVIRNGKGRVDLDLDKVKEGLEMFHEAGYAEMLLGAEGGERTHKNQKDKDVDDEEEEEESWEDKLEEFGLVQ
jgi:hypothetical protein